MPPTPIAMRESFGPFTLSRDYFDKQKPPTATAGGPIYGS